MSNIKEFNVSGTKYGLDLEAIGSYLGNQLLKEYIDSQAGSGAGGGDYVVVNALSEVTSPKNGMKAYIAGKGEYIYGDGKWWWSMVLINELPQEEVAAYVAQLKEGNFYNNIKLYPNGVKISAWDTVGDTGWLHWGGDCVAIGSIGYANGNIAFNTFGVSDNGTVSKEGTIMLPPTPTEGDENDKYVLTFSGGVLAWGKLD